MNEKWDARKESQSDNGGNKMLGEKGVRRRRRRRRRCVWGDQRGGEVSAQRCK